MFFFVQISNICFFEIISIGMKNFLFYFSFDYIVKFLFGKTKQQPNPN